MKKRYKVTSGKWFNAKKYKNVWQKLIENSSLLLSGVDAKECCRL